MSYQWLSKLYSSYLILDHYYFLKYNEFYYYISTKIQLLELDNNRKHMIIQVLQEFNCVQHKHEKETRSQNDHGFVVQSWPVQQPWMWIKGISSV